MMEIAIIGGVVWIAHLLGECNSLRRQLEHAPLNLDHLGPCDKPSGEYDASWLQAHFVGPDDESYK